MVYTTLAACFGWVATSCLFAYLLLQVLDRQNEERAAHRIEVDRLTDGHAEALKELLASHRKEVADLCQRIQAPQVAVAQHIPSDLPPDPPQVDLDDDATLQEIRRREGDLNQLATIFRERAEELAAET